MSPSARTWNFDAPASIEVDRAATRDVVDPVFVCHRVEPLELASATS